MTIKESIGALRICLVTDPFELSKFNVLWGVLIEAISNESSEVYGLSGLEDPLEKRGLHQEKLFVLLLLVSIRPRSAENQCFLGHAYRNLDQYEKAVSCYLKAYEIASDQIKKIDVGSKNSLWLDASDYLYYAAWCSNESGKLNEALVHVVNSLSILQYQGVEDKKERVRSLRQKIMKQQENQRMSLHR